MMNEDRRSVVDFMPSSEPSSEFSAQAGTVLPLGKEIADKSRITEALRTVHDPEIPVNIYDLGLVYKNEIESDGSVHVEMTLTAPGCPVAGEMPQWVADALAAVDGVGEVNVHLVWDPPWTQDMMTEAAKLELGML